MQTTGLASEPIGGLYEGDRLGSALREARRRTLALYSHLDLGQLRVPCLPIVNPPLWELAHVAWFQEFWCLRQGRRDGARRSLLHGADDMFDSGTVPHDSRWTLAYPPEGAIRSYLGDTLDATLDSLPRSAPDAHYFYRLALLHEDMHGEALLMTLQTLGLPAPPVAAREAPRGLAAPGDDVRFDGGEFDQGTPRGEHAFVFDNEKWAHPVRVGPFAISAMPVLQGEFAAFVEDQGYWRRAFWTDEGWQWREAAGAEQPCHWRRDAGQWLARRFDLWGPIDPASPMVHVSRHEASAYCRWAGRRLPTEAEWEFAARNGGSPDRFPWGGAPCEHAATLDLEHWGPAALPDPSPARSGMRLLMGGVWEWTASAFAPYPGFRADPYEEYSRPWFHSHGVLRGGSFATRSRLVHNRFRNFYLPERSDVFAGFRTCAVDAA